MEGAPARLFMLEAAPLLHNYFYPSQPLLPFPTLEHSSVRYQKYVEANINTGLGRPRFSVQSALQWFTD